MSVCLFSIFRWCCVNICKISLQLYWYCTKFALKCLCVILIPIPIVLDCIFGQCWRALVGFVGGFALGMMYYYYLLIKIPFPNDTGAVLALSISLLLGLGNAVCGQLRCISLLTFPMYCGKPGRGVLKAVVLTCVVAGPITNMALNAKEVVRVFACSNQLSYNLSKARCSLMASHFKKAVLGLRKEIGEIKDTMRSIREVVAPIESEIEDTAELEKSLQRINYVDDMFMNMHRSDAIENKYISKPSDQPKDIYQTMYLKKLEYRCQDQLSRLVTKCTDTFERSFSACTGGLPWYAAWLLCWPMKITYICNVLGGVGADVCDSRKQVDPGFGEGYVSLKRIKTELSVTPYSFKDVKLQYVVTNEKELIDMQDAKETGERVLHDFEEKIAVMRAVITAVNVCVALLFLRVALAAGAYHDLYLTSIQHDNVYITGYFKRIDGRRQRTNKPTLLPLKKMERSKYIDIHSFSWLAPEQNRLFSQALKVMLEVVTATTFVMLDRLFYEALQVVRQHAQADASQHDMRDLDIEVEGAGALASMVRKLLSRRRGAPAPGAAPRAPCLPRPRLMPPVYFVQIYGGYLWILLLLYLNPYTLRLRRLICAHFYPRREKQRVLHLYNDILKKRLKMHKTVRRRAARAARAHYLAGESLLSLSAKFPQLLGWLRVFPAARMACLICGETEPRDRCAREAGWHACRSPRCPFVWCASCWREAGARCLACDPALAQLSDVDSLSDDQRHTY